MKLIVVLMFAGIVYSLASGAYYLYRDQPGSRRLARALTWRIGLSVALFGFLILAANMGWIAPHPIGG